VLNVLLKKAVDWDVILASVTQRYMHLSPAALDSAIRLLDQPFSVQSFGDILETGRVSEEKING